MFTMRYAREEGNTFFTNIKGMKAEIFRDIFI